MVNVSADQRRSPSRVPVTASSTTTPSRTTQAAAPGSPRSPRRPWRVRVTGRSCRTGRMGVMSEPQSNAARIREINDSLRYTMWSVFRLADVLGDDAFRGVEADEVEKLFAQLGE